jgi:hypothetical protein
MDTEKIMEFLEEFIINLMMIVEKLNFIAKV